METNTVSPPTRVGENVPDLLRSAAGRVEALPQARVTGVEVRVALGADVPYEDAYTAYEQALAVLGKPGAWISKWGVPCSRVGAVALLRTAADAVERGDTTDLPAREAASIASGAALMQRIADRHGIDVEVMA